MRWAILAILLVAVCILAALFSSSGTESAPMLLVATCILLFFALTPLILSKRSRKDERPRRR